MELSEANKKMIEKWREKRLADELLEQAGRSAASGSGTDVTSALALIAIAKYLQIICDLQIKNIK